MHGRPIINNHALPRAINKKPHPISPVRWFFRSFEYPLHDEGVFADGCDCWEEVAVAKFALLQISGFDFALENEVVPFHKLGRAFPLDLFSHRPRAEMFGIIAKLFINKFMVAVQTVPDIEIKIFELDGIFWVLTDIISNFTCTLIWWLPLDEAIYTFWFKATGISNLCFSSFLNLFSSTNWAFFGDYMPSDADWQPPIYTH